MYKDKDKQREAQRNWVRQKRAAKGSTKQGSTEGVTQGITDKVLPEGYIGAVPGTPPILEPNPKRGKADRVMPFDNLLDVVPEDKAAEFFAKAEALIQSSPKRGKDIKCFADLPADVQQTINKMSVFHGKIDRAIKISRTEAAIKYQHQHQEYEKNYHGQA